MNWCLQVSIILKRKSIGVLLVGAIAGLTMGGVTAYWWLNEQRPLPPDLPFGSNTVPQDALMTVSLTTDLRQWQQLRQFGTPETQAWFKQTLTEWGDRLIQFNSDNYQQEIAPWIGDEVTIVALQRPRASEEPGLEDDPPLPNPPQEQVYALLVPIADPVQAEAQLNQWAAGRESVARTYKGVSLRPFSDGETQWLARLNDQTLAIAAEPDTLERLIDTARGGNAVTHTTAYQQAFERIAVPFPIARIYVNAAAANQVAIANSLQPVPLAGLSPLHQNQGMAATVALQPDGLMVRGANWLPDNSDVRYGDQPAVKRSPTWLPDDTLLMVAGSDFSQFWQHSQPQAQGDGRERRLATPTFLERAIRTTTGLNPEADLLPWMDGEFALAVVPTGAESESANGQGGAGVVLIVQPSDRDAAEAALTKLDQAVQERYDFQVSTGTLGNTSVVNWTSKFRSLTVTRGWLGEATFIALGAIAPQMVPKADPPLADHPLFQATQSDGLDASSGRFFINLEQLLSQRGQIPLPSLPPTGEAVVESIQAIGVTTAIQGDRMTRYDIRVLLKKTAPAPTVSRRATPSQILPPEAFSTPVLPSAQ